MTHNELLDRFVTRLIGSGEFEDLRFIYAGRTTPAEKPVESFFAACSVSSLSRQRVSGGYTEKATLRLTVYAPHNVGKRELSQMCQRLYAMLYQRDFEEIVGKITVSQPHYDEEMYTLCQAVEFEINQSFITLPDDGTDEEEELPQVYELILEINGEPVSVRSFSVHSEQELYTMGELLSGSSGMLLVRQGACRLSIISAVAAEMLPRGASGVRVRVSADNEEYSDCLVSEVKCRMSDSGERVYEYTLLSNVSVKKEGCGFFDE